MRRLGRQPPSPPGVPLRWKPGRMVQSPEGVQREKPGEAPSRSRLHRGCRRFDPGRAHRQLRMFTLRAITSASSTNPVMACTIMNSFARTLSGMTSVGLNAIALDAEKYR